MTIAEALAQIQKFEQDAYQAYTHGDDVEFGTTNLKMLIEVPRLRRTVQAILELHRPYGIYTECGHNHESGNEPGVVMVEDIGLTCAKMYDICNLCCREDDNQSEICTYHKHEAGKPVCKTVAILQSELLGAIPQEES